MYPKYLKEIFSRMFFLYKQYCKQYKLNYLNYGIWYLIKLKIIIILLLSTILAKGV